MPRARPEHPAGRLDGRALSTLRSRFLRATRRAIATVRPWPSGAAHEQEPPSATGPESAAAAGGDPLNLSVAPLSDLLAAQDAADAPALFDLGGRLAGAGRHDDAIDVLYRCTAADPRHLVAWLTLAQILAHRARYGAAMDACLRALEIDPGSAPATASLQQILPAAFPLAAAADMRTRLIEVYRVLLERRPDDVEMWLQLGATLDGQVSEAERTSPIAELHHGEAGVATPIPSRPPPEPRARALLAAGQVMDDAALRAQADAIAGRNAELAQLIAAQHARLGFLASMENWIRYEHGRTYFRALGLFTRLHGPEREAAQPVDVIPEALLPGFTMDGRVPVEQGLLTAGFPGRYPDIMSELDLQGLALGLLDRFPELGGCESSDLAQAARADAGRFANMLAQQAYAFRPSEYGLVRPEYQRLFEAVLARDFAGRRVATVTTLRPWIETFCLLVGARPTRISPTPVISRTERVPCMTIDAWTSDRSSFDHVIAYGVVEHLGLGRLGEPLDPSADLVLVERLGDMLRPGGVLMLFLPVGRDTVVFNAGRVYGRTRLPHLLRGWRLVEAPGFSEAMLDGGGEEVTLLVLRRESP
jgi:tetratricopeptide (TPR) repeat protein